MGGVVVCVINGTLVGPNATKKN